MQIMRSIKDHQAVFAIRIAGRELSMKRIVNALYKFGYERRAFVIMVLCVAAAIALPAQTLTTIHTFCSKGTPCLDGDGPDSPVVRA